MSKTQADKHSKIGFKIFAFPPEQDKRAQFANPECVFHPRTSLTLNTTQPLKQKYEI